MSKRLVCMDASDSGDRMAKGLGDRLVNDRLDYKLRRSFNRDSRLFV